MLILFYILQSNRLLETTKVAGAVVVAAYHTDLGDRAERNSGYFGRPWDWEKIRSNTPWLVQYQSTDDHCVPVEEARFVAEQTQNDYREFSGRGHFTQNKFPELLEMLLQKLGQA